jgi:hypothetical protein
VSVAALLPYRSTADASAVGTSGLLCADPSCQWAIQAASMLVLLP